MTLSRLGEFGLIDLLSRGAPVSEGVIVGIGDDTAVVSSSSGQDLLLTCDLLHEGVHFRREWFACDPGLLGRKALAVSISDIASKGGRPRYCLVTLAAGPDLAVEFVRAVFEGLYDLARQLDVSVVGGDTVGLADGLLLDVFLTGEVASGRALLRSSALPGDLIVVTGRFGLARAGLQLLEQPDEAANVPQGLRRSAIRGQLSPPVRLAAAQRLSASGLIHAMSDTSDGLANQVHHICRASGTGAVIDMSCVPIDDTAAVVARTYGVDPLVWALWGGEDYELMLTIPSQGFAEVQSAAADVSLTVVGEVTGPGSIDLRWPGGRVEPLAFGGYEHFRRPSGEDPKDPEESN